MTTPPESAPLSWRALEARVPLDDLPDFHRAFLDWRGVEGAVDIPLRRVQQRVEAELNKWVHSGQATRSGDDVLVEHAALDGFAAARPWLTAGELPETAESGGTSG